MRTYAPLLSALIPQISDPPLQPSNVPAPLTQISALPLQQGVPTLQPLSACDTPPLIYVLLQRRCKLPLRPSTVRDYVPLISALLFRQCVPLRQP